MLENEKEIEEDSKRYGFINPPDYIRFCTRVKLQEILKNESSGRK